ncbi:class I SAM-dependent methyltransferase [Amycolatopsis alba]|uniref:SAM-dependent methyltransferase n=1 Tax=Amycolatopsis alba DSM 44262 TaxID=1125972 RepID=A0A229RY86_AMYAL|nr:class I SAM-dependent methyltransferase [Amycolatopsis alba]OXM51633.1 SAM-dependent methyltransferase [Amycolatopsis alba DSM 44262]
MNLAANNIAYRRPDLYDALTRDSTAAATCRHLIDQYGTSPAGSVLDLGCGTARDLARLATTTRRCVGVDLQPALIEHARRRYPGLDLRVGDLRTVRLANTFDTITCLGNSLAYLHHNSDIRAAFATFAAHAHAGTLLIISTQIAPTVTTASTHGRIAAAGLGAEVTTEHSWDPRTQIATVRRTWRLENGTTERDLLERRVLFPRELELYAGLAGFKALALFTDLEDNTGPLIGSTAYFVAGYNHEPFSALGRNAELRTTSEDATAHLHERSS